MICPDCEQEMLDPEDTEEGDYWCPEYGYLSEGEEE